MTDSTVEQPAPVEAPASAAGEVAVRAKPQVAVVALPAGAADHRVEPGGDADASANPQARRIAMINQKGGVGKTTTTVNIGAALARMGHRVLLVDMDPQAHLTLHLGLHPEELELSAYELMTDVTVTAGQVVRAVSDNLWVLPASVDLAGVEAELAPKMITGQAQRILAKKLAMQDGAGAATNARSFDHIFIDCPPSLGLLAINAMTLANEVIIPMQAHFLALQGVSQLLETVSLVRQSFNDQLRVSGIVLCMHEKQTLLAGEVLADIEAFLREAHGTNLPWAGARVYQPAIRRNIKLAECPSFGQTVFDYAPDCRGAADYMDLAKSIAVPTP